MVGASGRRGEPLSGELFLAVQESVVRCVQRLGWAPERRVLVSGGAAFADHAAVALFLRGGWAGLELHLPCAFRGAFARGATGERAQALHRAFSDIVHTDSIAELQIALDRGARVHVHNGGFLARNGAIASTCDALLAYTFEHGDAPAHNSGSGDTWRKCRARKFHMSLAPSV